MNLSHARVPRPIAVFGAIVVVVATVLAIMLPAQARQSGYTVTGGPDVHFAGANVVFKFTTGQRVDCPTFDLDGDVIYPGVNRAFETGGLALDSLTASGCTLPPLGPLQITPHGNWKVAVTGLQVGSVSPIRLHDVEFTVEASQGMCTFDVVGDVDGTFDDGTQVLTPAGSTLEIAAIPVPAGPLCPFLGFASGVGVSVDSGTWTNVPPTGSTALTVTNP